MYWKFYGCIGNDDVISVSLRILAMFINLTALSKKTIHKFSGVFFPSLSYKRFINLRFYEIDSLKITLTKHKTSWLILWTLTQHFMGTFQMWLLNARKGSLYQVRNISDISASLYIPILLGYWQPLTESCTTHARKK